LIAMIIMAANVDESARLAVTMSGIWGIVVYIGVQVLSHLLGGEPEIDDDGNAVMHDSNGAASGVVKAGIGGFLYLEVLDASFSFDGVIGAFALTTNILLIAIGLGIGAMYVRSMTIMLVERGALAEFCYLEHGAFYSIFALSIIMFLQPIMHVHELITGGIGMVLIALSFYASITHNKRET